MKKLLLGLLLSVSLVLQGVAIPVIAQENIITRDRNSLTVDLGNGLYQYRASMGAIHYRGVGGAWTPINNEITGNTMTAADYSFTLLQQTFNAGQVVEFAVGGEYLRFQPMALEWTNDIDQIQPISMPQAVAGVINNPAVPIISNQGNKEGQVEWIGAYGPGIDFKWITQTERLAKRLVVSSLSGLPTPTQTIINGGGPALRFNLIFTPSGGVNVYVDDVLWDKRTKQQTFGLIDFRSTNGTSLWRFQPLLYWDSDGKVGQSIATLRRAGNSLYIEVRVPYSWLQSAVFPVTIDTDVNVQINSDTDDCFRRLVSSYWATAATYQAAGRWSNTDKQHGGGMRFNSVTVPAGATITDSYLQFVAERSWSGTANTRVSGELNPTPTTFSTSADFDARFAANQTSAIVDWDSIPSWTQNSTYNSTTISTVIQELVDQGGWASGNSMVIFWEDFDNRSADTGLRTGYDYSVSPANSPRLYITYTTAPAAYIPVIWWY